MVQTIKNTQIIALFLAFFCLTLFAIPSFAQSNGAQSNGWFFTLFAHAYGPKKFLAIDKSSQILFLFQQKSPLTMKQNFPCTTGQARGDKQAQGDMRTPEGVYFIEKKVDQELEWELYGNLAYELNYPNPVDKIKGKTGFGIWLHGRGKELVPYDTRGCVALNQSDLESLGTELKSGLPIFIASRVAPSIPPIGEEDQDHAFAERVKAWANAWQHKSKDFFSYYNANLFALGEGVPFETFCSYKTSVFKQQAWIQILVANIYAAQGPDYWVTWFDQLYRTSDGVSQTGKRLYWQKNQQGQWKIVGKEYALPSQDLLPMYMQSKQEEVKIFLNSWRQSWLEADLTQYAQHYLPQAEQNARRGIERIKEYKTTLWQEKPPKRIEIDDIQVKQHPQGLAVIFEQQYEDSSGYTDAGIKTLLLSPTQNDSWLIVKETWRQL